MYGRVRSGRYSSISEAIAPPQYAPVIVTPGPWTDLRGLDRAYEIAWGADADYFVDTTFGYTDIYLFNDDPTSDYRESIYVGDYGAGVYVSPLNRSGGHPAQQPLSVSHYGG